MPPQNNFQRVFSSFLFQPFSLVEFHVQPQNKFRGRTDPACRSPPLSPGEKKRKGGALKKREKACWKNGHENRKESQNFFEEENLGPSAVAQK
jgi:hypothetical protein